MALAALHTRFLSGVERIVPERDPAPPVFDESGRTNPVFEASFRWRCIRENVGTMGEWAVGWFEAVFRRFERHLCATTPTVEGNEAVAVAVAQSEGGLTAGRDGDEQSRSVSEPQPDGPFEPFGFRFAGREIDLSRSRLRHKLVGALWDSTSGRRHPSRLLAEVKKDPGPESARSKTDSRIW